MIYTVRTLESCPRLRGDRGQAHYSVTVAAANLNQVWRRVQGELAAGFDYLADGWPR